ncbi:MAG TPA: ABC transporter ATP-binding protein [Mycobacteriales bacterium]|nr:ABC transporter ATP-binding protein [Mycobacteriales bacterium]
MSERLPVAHVRDVRAYARLLLRRHPRALVAAVALYAAAAVAGLAGPPLLGRLVESVSRGTTRAHVDTVALLLAAFVLLQTALTRVSRLVSLTLAERVFAELREDFLARVVDLPLSTVERAGSGDLLTRMTSDVDTLARTVRDAVPEVVVAGTTTLVTMVAAFLVAPRIALAGLVAVPPLWVSTRWYLRRAPAGYLRERVTFATFTAGLTETAEGARTVEALGLRSRRVRRSEADLATAVDAELYTLGLRCRWFPFVDVSFLAPVIGVLLLGGWLHARGLASLAQVTAVTLYVQQLLDPLDRLLGWLDELQIGASSLARLVGVTAVPDDRAPTGAEPDGERLDVADVRFAYVDGRDVLHGVDLGVEPGERLAVVGPSGAGKSTIGRLLAGIHGPRTGRVELGGVPLLELPLDRLRREVALVTQEHHVFAGTVADNLRLAAPDADDATLRSALAAVDALDWADALPDGLGTRVGSGGYALTPAQQQQLALARLVLIDPHTLVLDEATSLLDPRAARHLERSLGAVLRGRTVVAIAHRLHTAHDADRVAVVEGGRVTELGAHDELLAAHGSYAALWASWTTESSS